MSKGKNREHTISPTLSFFVLFYVLFLGVFCFCLHDQTSCLLITISAPEVPSAFKVSLWEKVQQEQLEKVAKQPPTNAFEEMIQWTKEGKLWQFPINNEQGDNVHIGIYQLKHEQFW